MLYEAIMRTSSKAQLIFAWHIYAIATTAHYPQKHIFFLSQKPFQLFLVLFFFFWIYPILFYAEH